MMGRVGMGAESKCQMKCKEQSPNTRTEIQTHWYRYVQMVVVRQSDAAVGTGPGSEIE